jgi:osmotically-inducible protein OsmY
VESDQSKNNPADLALADTIRREVEYDRGLAPSLQRVIIEVRDGRIILRGAVKSDLDARVIVNNLRDIAGVSRVTNNLEISSAMD